MQWICHCVLLHIDTVGVFVWALAPFFVFGFVSAVCFAVSAGETQVWLGAYSHVRTEPSVRHRPHSRKKKINVHDLLRVVELCSGAGFMGVGLEHSNFEVVLRCDYNDKMLQLAQHQSPVCVGDVCTDALIASICSTEKPGTIASGVVLETCDKSTTNVLSLYLECCAYFFSPSNAFMASARSFNMFESMLQSWSAALSLFVLHRSSDFRVRVGNAGSLALGGMFSSTWHGASVSDGRVDLADSTCPDVGVTLVANTLSVTNFRK